MSAIGGTMETTVAQLYLVFAGNGLRLYGLAIDISEVVDVEVLEADALFVEVQSTMLLTDIQWHIVAVCPRLTYPTQQKLASVGIPTYDNICIVHTFVISIRSFILRRASLDILT